MLLGGVQWTSGPATRPQESSPCSIVCKHTRCSQQRRCQSQCSSLVRTIARGTRRCVSASARASHQVVVRSDYEDQHDEVDSTDARVEEESLQVLEWPAVCKQVACFCGTVMAAQRVAAGQLPMGKSYGVSQALLQQTAEALEAGLSVRGVYDISPALSAASDPGVYLNAAQLQGVADTLDAMLQLRATVLQASRSNSSSDDDSNHSTSSSSAPLGAILSSSNSNAVGSRSVGDSHGRPDTAAREREAIHGAPHRQGSPYRYPALAALAEQAVHVEAEAALLTELRRCITAGSLASSASEGLAAVRAERQTNAEALRKLMDEQARTAFQRKAADSRAVTLMRGRYCIGIKAGRQSDLPKGSVKLGASQTGATQYWEPAPAIPLNNAAALLGEREAREEGAVLLRLTRTLAQHTAGIMSLLEVTTQLDMAAARAAHAHWQGATRPLLLDVTHPAAPSSPSTVAPSYSSTDPSSSPSLHLHPDVSAAPAHHSATEHTAQGRNHSKQGSHSAKATEANHAAHLRTHPLPPHRPGPLVPGPQRHTSRVWVPGALHPLLLERALPPLPAPPSLDDHRFERNFSAPGAWEVRRSVFEGPAAGQPGSSSSSSTSFSQAVAPAPQPLDLRLPDVAVVAITGPNTGGKTVTLKTVGLMALMAKAGMFVPADPAAVQQYGQPVVAWFGSVLADIGDAQSLQQSLSTFSGHIRRIKNVLAAAKSDSLVLLDEVGSGTDPVEGAALARSILDKLAGMCPLTVATTHHAELKHAASEDGRYSNVAVEFDARSLRPTYRLLWGAAGASNALDIAQLLGFDGRVVSEARDVAAATLADASGRAARMAATAAALHAQLEDMRTEVSEAQRTKAGHEGELSQQQLKLGDLQEHYSELQRSIRDIVAEKKRVAEELGGLLGGLAAAGGGDGPALEAVRAKLRELEELIPERIALAQNKAVMEEGDPADGDAVFVDGYNTGIVQRVLPGNLVEVQLGGALGLVALKGRSKGTIKVHKSKLIIQQRAKPLEIPTEAELGTEGAGSQTMGNMLATAGEQQTAVAGASGEVLLAASELEQDMSSSSSRQHHHDVGSSADTATEKNGTGIGTGQAGRVAAYSGCFFGERDEEDEWAME